LRPLSGLCAKRLLAAAALLAAVGCTSGGGGSSGTAGSGGTGTQGQAGANAGSSGGTSSAGTGGTEATAGRGGSQAGTAGTTGSGGVAGTTAGAGAGTSGSAGAGGTGGTGGTGGGTGGRGGTVGTGGVSGASGRGGASGGAGTAAGGSSGAGGAVASPVTPTMPGAGRYRFAFGDVVLEIDAMTGARVGTLTLAGANIIVPASLAARVDGGMDNTTWGSVFWTSPRSAWPPPMWPPPVAIDNAPYTTGGISGNHVVLTGPTETTLGVNMKKDVSADATSGWIKLAYTINATKSLKAGPWEISRVPRGGIVFFPYTGTVTNQVPLTITQSGGILWFNDNSNVQSPNGDKLFADGMGWTAYVAGGNLFLKRFADQPGTAFPTGEGEVDVYPGNGFLEFEVEGPYTQLAASGNLPWSVEWKVVKVPSSVTVAVGSTTLLDFAKQQVAQ